MSTSNPEADPSAVLPSITESSAAGNDTLFSINPVDGDNKSAIMNVVVSPQSFLDSLPNHIPDSNSRPCAICISEGNDLSIPLKELPCGPHYFHGDCLLKWLKKDNTCPVCRFVLGVDPECPDLRNTRWVKTGEHEWRSVGDGPDHWTLRWTVGNGSNGQSLRETGNDADYGDYYSEHDYDSEYTPTSPVYSWNNEEMVGSPEFPASSPSHILTSPRIAGTSPSYIPTSPIYDQEFME